MDDPHEPAHPAKQGDPQLPAVPASAADAPAYKRPTPSISTLLTSVPPIHGKLPPLRASTDGTAGLLSSTPGGVLHPPGHLQPLGHAPAVGYSLTAAQHDAALLKQQLEQQEQHSVLGVTAEQQGVHEQPSPPHDQHQQHQQPEQNEQQGQKKHSWASALQHPREFFLRFSQVRSSTAAVEDGAAAPMRLLQQQDHAHQQQQRGELDEQQSLPPGAQQQQQQQQHWWQRRSSRMPLRSSSTDTPPAAAAAGAAGDSPASGGSSSSKRGWPARRLQLLRLLDSPSVSWLLILMSLYVIFQEDFKYAVLPPAADLWCESITLAFLITFLVEIGLCCLVRPGFFLSFYFWLDTVAVLSLAFELPALRAVLLLGETQEYVNLNNEDSYLMAAGAQALVSSKAGRAAKMVRLFRQLQLIRLFRQLELRQRLKRVLAEGAVRPDGLTAAEAQVLTKYKHSESRVGQRLSDLTMKRVISGILAMLVVLPALEITSGINGATASLPLAGMEMLHMQALTGGDNTTAFATSLKTFQRNVQYQLAGQTTGGILRLVLANTSHVSNPAYSSIGGDKAGPAGAAGSSSSSTNKRSNEYRRYLELQAAYFHSWLCPSSSALAASIQDAPPASPSVAAWSSSTQPYVVIDAKAAIAAAAAAAGPTADAAAVLMAAGCVHVQSFVLLDIKWSLQAQSVYGIARTLFLVCLLGLGSYLIHSDTYRLVLQPVQRMVERVREMAEDPLMLAAVRNNPLTSGSGEAPKVTLDSTRTSTGPEKPVNPSGAGAAAAATGASGSSDGSSKGPKIRFWPSVRVHAVQEGLLEPPGSPTAAAASPGFFQKGRPSAQQQQQLQSGSGATGAVPAGDVPARKRASSIQVAVQQARRLSAHVAAGVSAAGRAADRVRVQLLQRASAIKQLIYVDEAEQETSQGQYETRLLEQSIYKICALLAVGFGDAGAEVIAENIKKEGDLNPCMPGKKAVAVFGFCDIRRFTDTTEVLQEGVMEFVNVIAHLVHSAVAARGGAANKNIGDAFLLVWKLPKGLSDRDVSLLSSGGAGGSTAAPSHLAPASPHRAMRTATLNWPGLAEEEEEQQQEGAGRGSNAGSSSPLQHTSLLGAAATPSPRGGAPSSPDRLHQQPCSSSCSPSAANLARPPSLAHQAATEQEISNMLQQQAAQLSIQRAASGIGGRDGGGGHHKRPSGGVSTLGGAGPGAGTLLGSVDGGQQVEPSGLSSSGLKRAMLSIKSVTATPLSAAAKASIINTIADSALASFVVIQVAINVSRVLKAYSNRADLNARMPGFRVQMGFGLHVGWAIEGAIGSEYKIDASYLSPNVNLASRLEAATKQYSVPMLLSRDFVDCLSPGVRAKVRQVDCVTVKGSNQPLGLFCYDLDLAAAEAELAALAAATAGGTASSSGSASGALGSSRVSTARSMQAAAAGDGGGGGADSISTAAGGLVPVGRVRQSLAVLPDAASAARSSVVVSAGHNSWGSEDQTGPDPAEVLLSLDCGDDWCDNPVVSRSWAISWDFKEAFDEAFELYIAGHWSAARGALEDLLTARSSPDGSPFQDPPSRTLLDFMASHGYTPPQGWAGVRELTEK